MDGIRISDSTRQPQPATETRKHDTTQTESRSGANAPEQKNEPTKAEDRLSLSEDAREIQQLAARDREVRAHEAAHAAIGGQLAGAPKLTYATGPDGLRYAVGGEVSIDTSAVAGNPEATIRKAETIRAAALAPMEPSSRDLSIAAEAAQMMAQARADLAAQQTQAAKETSDDTDPSLEALPQTNRIFKGMQEDPSSTPTGRALSLYT